MPAFENNTITVSASRSLTAISASVVGASTVWEKGKFFIAEAGQWRVDCSDFDPSSATSGKIVFWHDREYIAVSHSNISLFTVNIAGTQYTTIVDVFSALITLFSS